VDAAAGLPPRWAQTQLIDVAFGSLSPGDRLEAMTALGHQDAFLRPRLSGRYRFSQGTLAGTPGNERDAPKVAARRIAIEAGALARVVTRLKRI